ncbi:MAG TPA: ATP-binding protein [Bacteroidales bacterium]|jgi:anti-sigma regulatory factor (Ser/Thr protein kinase)|nr:ATP-binding protein [Bacteroidales bacterium]MDD4235236.1 ATP-binding protein [Bacteroidales bacterium]MDY0160332.1 ATP-binding protein [Bacteroidales bacterium]HXK81094.1 ATP-binding protein [Bacteroidales bacterium]
MKTIDLHLSDIINNSIRAQANEIELMFEYSNNDNSLLITIKDDGIGMDEIALKQACDPYFTSRTERKVGLGIPLFKFHAEQTGGSFEILSEKGKGTMVKAMFLLQHPDCQPLGDIYGTISRFICQFAEIKFFVSYKEEHNEFKVNTLDLKEALNTEKFNPIYDYELIKSLLQENMKFNLSL